MIELTKEQYDETFFPSMVNVSETAEGIVDLWSYADQVIESDYNDWQEWDWRVAHVYETSNESHQHIYVPIPKDNTYMVVIVDKPKKFIIGHYILDLHQQY